MQEKKQEYTKLLVNVGVTRKALRKANATYSDLQAADGMLSPAGIDAVAVMVGFALAAGEGISYEEAQDYVDSMHPSDDRYQSLVKRTAELLKKNSNP